MTIFTRLKSSAARRSKPNDLAAAEGLTEVWGDVARENTAMLTTAKSFGFERRAAEDFSRVKIVKTLR